jgi:hypothetical protein
VHNIDFVFLKPRGFFIPSFLPSIIHSFLPSFLSSFLPFFLFHPSLIASNLLGQNDQQAMPRHMKQIMVFVGVEIVSNVIHLTDQSSISIGRRKDLFMFAVVTLVLLKLSISMQKNK